MATRKMAIRKKPNGREPAVDAGGSGSNRGRPRRRAERKPTRSKRAVARSTSSRGSRKGASAGSSGRSGASKPKATSRQKTTRRGLRGVGPKEQRMYEHIKEDAQKSGRYGRRAKEVAARTVMKQHRQKGHRKGE